MNREAATRERERERKSPIGKRQQLVVRLSQKMALAYRFPSSLFFLPCPRREEKKI